MKNVYIPQFEPLSAGSVSYSGGAHITIRPGEPLRFDGCGDLVNALFEPDGLTVAQAGLFTITLNVELIGELPKLALTAGTQRVAEFSGERVSATLVKRLTPDSKLSVVNLAGSDVTELSAYLSAVQTPEYRAGSYMLMTNEK